MSGGRRVSVIIPVRNGMRYVDRCIRSVRAQTYPNLEVIVVDDASTDGTLEYVRETFPSVLTVHNQRTLGYPGAINEGLMRATGDYIAPLNVDTEVAPNWMSPMVDLLESDPSIGAVSPAILIDQCRTRVNALGGAIHFAGLSFCKGLNEERKSVPSAPFRVPGVSGASFVIRRDLLEQMGGAPAECFHRNDDVVLSWTLRLMGHDIYCAPQSVVYHRYRLTMDADKLYLLERNRQSMMLASLRASTILVTLPLAVMTEAAIMAYCLARGPAYVQAKLRAIGSVWRERATTRARRARLQELRRVSDWNLFGQMEKNLQWKQLLGILGETGVREDDGGGEAAGRA